MFLKYLTTVYQPIVKTKFTDEDDFMDDYHNLKELLKDTLYNLDESLEVHLTENIFNN